jgi:hypothetical protein
MMLARRRVATAFQRAISDCQPGRPTTRLRLRESSGRRRGPRSAWTTARLLPAVALPVGLLLLDPGAGGAQGLRPWEGGHGLALSAGVLRSGQADETISPLHFVGSGAALGIGWARIQGASSLEAGLEAGAAILSPTERSDGAGERLAYASARIAGIRGLGHARDGGTLALGAAARTFATVTGYRSVASQPMESAFLFGGVMLGPLARWRAGTPAGELEVEASTGLVSWVDHPYGSIGRGRPLLDFRLASPASLRNGSARVVWTAASGRRLDLVAAYRFDYLAYRDVQPVRSVGQSLSLGVRIRPRGSGA